ncbi:MAG: Gfo/Idh/MocA family oxidoreductase [Acidobacteriota bacterium]|nr:Gfo/Idh/MocA family oxidoreductase [Acidobacteriota bacterium]MXW70090.1 Gfo/Idh/MocA family oxidoreductase [Acidobacteriota bacterium]MXX84912.1 Gfo/Idh/MocA family oxidoreductase [Acidobacteriota bacterium]
MTGATAADAAPGLPTVAIVGCGRIARVHAANLAPHARLAFTSRSSASARALAARFSGEALAGFEEALERPGITAVAICSPLEYHATQTVAALEAGKSVLVEKPMAQSRTEVDAIGRALAGRPPGSLMVAENYLYKPSLGRLGGWLPEIGPLRRVRVSKLTRQQPSDWRVGHGALLEGGIHFVALLGAIVGTEPEAVRADFPGGSEPERHARLELEYPSGVRAEVRYGWDTPALPGGILQHSVVEGEGGRIVFESNGLYLWSRAGRGIRLRVGPFADLMGFGAMARDFLRSVRNPARRPRSDFEIARRDLEIVFRAYDTR